MSKDAPQGGAQPSATAPWDATRAPAAMPATGNATMPGTVEGNVGAASGTPVMPAGMPATGGNMIAPAPQTRPPMTGGLPTDPRYATPQPAAQPGNAMMPGTVEGNVGAPLPPTGGGTDRRRAACGAAGVPDEQRNEPWDGRGQCWRGIQNARHGATGTANRTNRLDRPIRRLACATGPSSAWRTATDEYVSGGGADAGRGHHGSPVFRAHAAVCGASSQHFAEADRHASGASR
jgi:hypothetical protein